jgi:uncharacterized membrane protein YfcA
MPITRQSSPCASRASRLLAFAYGQLPTVFSQWVAYTLYRWENNIRIATVLGIVGAGGLGSSCIWPCRLFQQHRAASLIIAMLLLSWAVEQLSRLWRQHMAEVSPRRHMTAATVLPLLIPYSDKKCIFNRFTFLSQPSMEAIHSSTYRC